MNQDTKTLLPTRDTKEGAHLGPPAWDSAVASRIAFQGHLEDIEGCSGSVVPVQSLEGRQEGQLEGARILDHRRRCDRCLRFVQLPSPIDRSDRTQVCRESSSLHTDVHEEEGLRLPDLADPHHGRGSSEMAEHVSQRTCRREQRVCLQRERETLATSAACCQSGGGWEQVSDGVCDLIARRQSSSSVP